MRVKVRVGTTYSPVEKGLMPTMTLDNWSLRKKLISILLVYILCFFIAIGSSLFGFKQVNSLFDEVTSDSVPDIIAILELKSLSKRLFAEIQGFVATGDEDEIEEFEQATKSFDEWLQKWTVEQVDELEYSLKQSMTEHKSRFNDFAKTIFALASEKQKSIQELGQLQESILVETYDGQVLQFNDQLRDLLARFYQNTYHTVLWNPEEEHSNAHISKIELEERGNSIHQELSQALNKLALLSKSPHLVTSIQQIILVSEKLIASDKSIRETLELVEEYEEEILETIELAITLQIDEVSQAFNRAEHAVDNNVAFNFIIGLTSFIFCLFTFRVLVSSISKRLEILVNSVKEVTEGNLNTRAHINGLDELAHLGHSIDKMTRNLQETTVSKEYLNNILANMDESLIVTSKSGVIDVVNDKTLTILGYEREELLGKNIDIVLSNKETLYSARDDSDDQRRTECQYITKLGEFITVMFSSSPLLNDSQEDVGNICVATDIRRQKQIQMELEKSNINLQTMQSQLIQASKLASIGELSAGVAHELNQPLTVIRNGGQLIERRHKKGTLDDEKLQKFIVSVLTNSKRMMKIIDHLRTFSRRSSINFNPVDINKIVHDCFFMVGEQLRLHDISVDTQISDSDLRVLGETNQLEQVILNLINNARDALDTPGIESKRLTIATQLAEGDNRFVEVLISDNGHGMPEEVVKQIFDPFYTTKDEGKGTGLGLSISYGIVTAHQGTIDVYKTGEHGTTMRVRLPSIGANVEV